MSSQDRNEKALNKNKENYLYIFTFKLKTIAMFCLNSERLHIISGNLEYYLHFPVPCYLVNKAIGEVREGILEDQNFYYLSMERCWE